MYVRVNISCAPAYMTLSTQMFMYGSLQECFIFIFSLFILLILLVGEYYNWSSPSVWRIANSRVRDTTLTLTLIMRKLIHWNPASRLSKQWHQLPIHHPYQSRCPPNPKPKNTAPMQTQWSQRTPYDQILRGSDVKMNFYYEASLNIFIVISRSYCIILSRS